MSVRKIVHLNLIGHEINESLGFGYPDSDREIYCKKLHKVTEPMEKDCTNCRYFGDLMMGHGIACIWEDVHPADAPDERVVYHEQRYEELQRVSKLIDRGILQKG